MFIKKLDSGSGIVTVELNYDELRCVNNALYELSRYDDLEKDHDFKLVRKRFMEVFTILKHGYIPGFELNIMHDLIFKHDEMPAEDTNENEKSEN